MNRSLHKEVSRDELDYALMHMIRCEEITKAVINKITPDDFDEQTEFDHKLLWSIASEFYREYKCLISKDNMIVKVQSQIERLGYLTENAKETILAFIDYIYSPINFLPAYALDTLESFLFERRVGVKLINAAEKGMISKSIWDEIKQDENNCSFVKTVDIMPFANDPIVGIPPRRPTGVGFIDELLNGGPRSGELVGFLGPSGGGKTTVINQIAVSVATAKEHVAVFSYEQPVDPVYLVPVYATATGIPKDRWEAIVEGAKIENVLTEAEQAKFKAAKESIGTYLHYFDMRTSNKNRVGFGGIQEIALLVDDLENRRGIKLSAIMIDWFWPMATKAYDNLRLDRGKQKDMRVFAQQLTDELKALSNRKQIWTWIAHQIAPDIAARKKDFTFEDAAEFKSFAWFMDSCFVINKMDEDQLTSIKHSKGRNQKPEKRRVRLYGNLAKFALDDMTEYDAQQKCRVLKGQKNAVPTVRQPKFDNLPLLVGRVN